MDNEPAIAHPPAAAEPEWSALGLAPEILKRVKEVGFTHPTEIQAQSIPVAIARRDLIAGAKTGSGKTAAFCLPMIQALLNRKGTYGVILCPTREIALQT